MLDNEKLAEEAKEVKLDSDAARFEEVTDDVITLAKQVIKKYHEELINVKFMYLFNLKPVKSKGKIRLGALSRPGKLAKYLSGDVDYIMFLDKMCWSVATDTEKEALLDHEFCHADVQEDKKGNPIYGLRDHDVTEFNEIITRWGGWTVSLRETIEAAYEKGEENGEIKRLAVKDDSPEEIDAKLDEITDEAGTKDISFE